MKKKLKILLLFDLSEDLSFDQCVQFIAEQEEWSTHRDVQKALKSLGHEVILLGVYDSLNPLLDIVKKENFDVVFNIAEAFADKRELEANVASLVELLGIPYTGASPEALRICKDKSLTKKILTYHRISVPKFKVSFKARPLKSLQGLDFPVMVKPLNLEASEGISSASRALSSTEALERVKYLHERFYTDVIVEEFIEGRELYVAVMGNKRVKVYPPRELVFSKKENSDMAFATYSAKWSENYRKKWGIKSLDARDLDKKTQAILKRYSSKIYRLLKLSGYGRIDYRLRKDGKLYFIEANPNPALAQDDDFSLSVLKGNLSYKKLINEILKNAFLRLNSNTCLHH